MIGEQLTAIIFIVWMTGLALWNVHMMIDAKAKDLDMGWCWWALAWFTVTLCGSMSGYWLIRLGEMGAH